ncbi:hypothetical protein SPRG_05389 [Saprolegnia parasitica CBS 223.65]|uniref:E2F/DP family winged-helix DNA-binding domain-containing protein n=1 Tax=Saprolegnia parasitica (strain CBS 223.65) TaxID=695850 RepID=A0A067CRK3_SAPPC|nr:hypothetical protein SPRG_05389 [Saprolegnia parasitica CBS 223.65]KDO29146.1 hypothetical protein SPRG_05389 [Saprolegnia parasitica CBS 223.65]|eukprot:XP_012200026.1 hypothetical protein SPRG_05389 [Saprolegnia parasitica CBS 223.65]
MRKQQLQRSTPTNRARGHGLDVADDHGAVAISDDEPDAIIPDDVKAYFAGRMEGSPSTYTMVQVCEHILELLVQLSQREGTLLPLTLRARAIADGLNLPRRRIYDVLHIFDAIGLVTRVPKGKGYWYYGEGNIVPTLEQLRARAMAAVADVRTASVEQIVRILTPDAPTKDAGTALLRTTTKLLRILFAADRPVLQSELRLVDDNGSVASALAPAQDRRTYDVLTVLARCNVVQIRTSNGGPKRVSINPSLFSPAFSLFVPPPSVSTKRKGLRSMTATTKYRAKKRRSSNTGVPGWRDYPSFLTLPMSESVSSATDAAMALVDWDTRGDFWGPETAVDALFPVLDDGGTCCDLDALLASDDWDV